MVVASNRTTYIKVYKLFLTLSNVNQNIPTLTIKDLIEKLQKFLPGKKNILITKEFHLKKEDYHYHIFINITGSKGVRKNTYKKDFRKEFNKFSGITLDISGVKRVKNTLHYILKNIDIKSLISYISTKEREFLLRNVSLLKILDKKTSVTLSTISEIIKFDSIEEWSLSRIEKIILFRRKQNWRQTLWSLSRTITNVKETGPVLFSKYRRTENFLKIIDKYNIGWNHLTYMQKVIYFILIRLDYFKIRTKQKNLIVAGAPNRGKTSLLNKFIDILNDKSIFIFLGRRKRDFTGYTSGKKPILVFDDILSKKSKWDLGTLLKVWAHEEFIVDIKYKTPTIVHPTIRIILTNDPLLFRRKELFNLRARLQIVLVRKDPGWTKIEDEEFLSLCYVLTEDLLVSLTDRESLNQFIKWGFIYDLTANKPVAYK